MKMINDMELELAVGGSEVEQVLEAVQGSSILDVVADKAHDVYRFFEYVMTR